MAQVTDTTTLDVSYHGIPFGPRRKGTLDLTTLDVSYRGIPFAINQASSGTTYMQSVSFVLQSAMAAVRQTNTSIALQAQGCLSVSRRTDVALQFLLQASLTLSRVTSVALLLGLTGILTLTEYANRLIAAAFRLQGVSSSTRQSLVSVRFEADGSIVPSRTVNIVRHFEADAVTTSSGVKASLMGVIFQANATVTMQRIADTIEQYGLMAALSIVRQAAASLRYQLQGQLRLSKQAIVTTTYGLSLTVMALAIILRLITIPFGVASVISVSFLVSYLRSLLFVLGGAFAVTKRTGITRSFQLQDALAVAKQAARVMLLQSYGAIVTAVSQVVNQPVFFGLEGSQSTQTLPQKVLSLIVSPSVTVQRFSSKALAYTLDGAISLATKFGHLIDVAFGLAAGISIRTWIKRVPIVGPIALGIGRMLTGQGEGIIERAEGSGRIERGRGEGFIERVRAIGRILRGRP